MRIEKNTKITLEDMRSVSGEQKTLTFRIKQWFLNHRLNSRQKLLVNPINLATVVTVLPLALGFSQFLIHTSRSSLNLGQSSSFFEKNLPVFTQFRPKLNFETFEYISKSNSRICVKSPQSNFMFGRSNFVVTLQKQKPYFLQNQKFNGLSCDFYLLTSGNFLSKTSSIMSLARKLDELPAYLQGFKNPPAGNRPEVNSDFLFSNSRFLKLKKGNDEVSKSRTPFSAINLVSHSQNLKNKKLPLVTGFKQTFPKTLVSEFSLLPNLFYKDRLDFYNNKNQFNNELQSLFTEKSLTCFSNKILTTNLQEKTIQKEVNDFSYLTQISKLDEFSNLNLFLKEKSQLNFAFLIETILQELQKTNISEDIPNFRIMSGYNYPDMTADDLDWFYSGTLWKRKEFALFGVQTHTLPTNSREYTFTVKDFPDISIETTEFSLRNQESNTPFYTGPALILDSQRALDWRTHGKKNFRSWFHTYLSPLNSLMQPLENFFGVYESPNLVKNHKSLDSFDFSNTSLVQTGLTSRGNFSGIFDTIQSPFVRFAPSRLIFQIPADREQENTLLMKTLEVKTSKNTNQFVTVPILELQQPFTSSAGSESLILQNYSSEFTFLAKGNPDYIFSTDSFDTKNFVTKYSSGSYTKSASIYSKTKSSTAVTVDNWEPLTSTWWLIISQLSFAFFIFNVLKSILDNYGRELLGYLVNLVASLGILDESLKQEVELLLGQRDKGFRVVFESRKTFKDIVGIQKLLPEIYEVVWFLRNSARDFALSKTLPRGILLTGPPGTGKTLLVQALAGEAKVPVVVLSGSSLIEPGESGAGKLEMVFKEARELAPCIVFIDEIDTLAQKRSGVVQNPMGPDELVESLTGFEKPKTGSPFEQMKLSQKNQENEKESDTNSHNTSQEEQLSLLTQFLIEVDGIQARDGVIVIGATNRPEVLDPALIRPGRLEKILQVGLPGHQKRVEILQFYGQGLGYQTDIPWNYLGDRTAGFTAADLATLMNESTIKAVLTQTQHTIETIEHGIDRLTTSETEKYTVLKTRKEIGTTTSDKKLSSLTIASKMSILRLAYYQAGKIVLSYFLETHPKSLVASLWPRRPTIRSAQIATNLQNSVFEFARLCEITDRLVGCYAGKAAEVLFVQQFSGSKYAQLSTLGFEDLFFAQKLVYCILENWSFYSKKSHIQKIAQLAPNINLREFREIPEKLELYTGVVETIEIPPMSKALETQTSSLESKKKTVGNNWNAQRYYSIPWWQQQISSELEFVEKNFTNWSRLYLSNPEQSERNPEWLPPDEFYHSSSGLKNVKKAFANSSKTKDLSSLRNDDSVQFSTKTRFLKSDLKERYLPEKSDFSWNEIALLTRDYPGHSLILESFNKALVILNQNRELLDRLVVELLYQETLRQPEIERLLQEYKSTSSTLQEEVDFDPLKNKKTQKIEILESSWGSDSRKPMPRWIDFAEFSQETT